MRLHRSALASALASFGVAACVCAIGTVAHASISVPVTWDALLRGSTAAGVVTAAGPGSAHAVWEDGRICTYTRVHVDRAVAGSLATGDEAWVRTLGGVVGKVGQIVDGEPVFSPGRPSLVFLRPSAVGALEVTARGQGQFPIVGSSGSAGAPVVVRSNTVGTIVPRALPATGVPAVLAADTLHGHSVDDAARQITTAWTTAHAAP